MVKEMSSLITDGNVVKFSYSGATTIHLGHYSDVLLNELPDAVIISGGTNDIYGRNRRDVDTEIIARDIIDIGMKCRGRGVDTVYISSIIATRNANSNFKVAEINDITRALCVENNFIYIDNDFLTIDDLEKNDTVHLSWEGRRKLVSNYIDILNH